MNDVPFCVFLFNSFLLFIESSGSSLNMLPPAQKSDLFCSDIMNKVRLINPNNFCFFFFCFPFLVPVVNVVLLLFLFFEDGP